MNQIWILLKYTPYSNWYVSTFFIPSFSIPSFFVLQDQSATNTPPNEILEFNSDFQYIMENCTNDQLVKIIAIEQDMSREMKALIMARDYDLVNFTLINRLLIRMGVLGQTAEGM